MFEELREKLSEMKGVIDLCERWLENKRKMNQRLPV